MSIQKLDQLNDMQIDVLRELGNIGAGNAATSLSQLLNTKVNISLPTVQILDINDAVATLGGPENVIVAILAKLYGDLEGIMMFIIERSFANNIMQHLLGQEFDGEQLSEIQMSAISEVGNIMIGAYSGSISTLSQLKVKASVPAVTIDMVGAVLSVPAIEMGSVSDKVIFIQDNFFDESQSANMLFVPSIDSLNRLMKQLGIEL